MYYSQAGQTQQVSVLYSKSHTQPAALPDSQGQVVAPGNKQQQPGDQYLPPNMTYQMHGFQQMTVQAVEYTQTSYGGQLGPGQAYSEGPQSQQQQPQQQQQTNQAVAPQGDMVGVGQTGYPQPQQQAMPCLSLCPLSQGVTAMRRGRTPQIWPFNMQLSGAQQSATAGQGYSVVRAMGMPGTMRGPSPPRGVGSLGTGHKPELNPLENGQDSGYDISSSQGPKVLPTALPVRPPYHNMTTGGLGRFGKDIVARLKIFAETKLFFPNLCNHVKLIFIVNCR